MIGYRVTLNEPQVVTGVPDPAYVADRNSWVVSSMTLACAFTALFAGPTADLLGRKGAIITGCFLVTLGGALQASALDYAYMLGGRVVAGLAIGTLSCVVPMYVSEVAPKALRGFCGTLWQLNITLGILLANAVNWAFAGSNQTLNSWRWALGIQCAFSILLLTLVIFIPESPRSLVARGKSEEARRILNKLRPTIVVGKHTDLSGHTRDLTNIDLELLDMQEEVSYYTQHELTGFAGYIELFKPYMLVRTMIGIFLQFFQQLTGVNAIFYYGPTIMSLIGKPYIMMTLPLSNMDMNTLILVCCNLYIY
jgi:MFS family permease